MSEPALLEKEGDSNAESAHSRCHIGGRALAADLGFQHVAEFQGAGFREPPLLLGGADDHDDPTRRNCPSGCHPTPHSILCV